LAAPWTSGRSFRPSKDYDENGEKILAETALAPRQLRMALAYYREFRDEIEAVHF
jgi:hypothetical protein